MKRLEQRIEALERIEKTTDEVTIIRRFISPGNLNPPTNSIHGPDGQLWERQPGESEEELIERAKREAKRNQWGVAVLTADEQCHAKDVHSA